jgi:hypothetical protein
MKNINQRNMLSEMNSSNRQETETETEQTEDTGTNERYNTRKTTDKITHAYT